METHWRYVGGFLMGKKGHGKAQKKKLTKKEQKRLNHLKVINGQKDRNEEFNQHVDKKKKAA